MVGALVACLTGCSTAGLPVAGRFALPPAVPVPGLVLQDSGKDAMSPAFANAFNGYVGSVTAVGPLATFDRPTALAYVPDGTLYVADVSCIRRIAPDVAGRPTATTVAGDGTTAGWADGPVFQARFGDIHAMVGLPDGSLILADGNRLRRIAFDGHGGGTVTTLAGAEDAGYQDGDGAAARFEWLVGLALAPDGTLYGADNGHIRAITFDPATSRVSVGTYYTDANQYFTRVTVGADGVVWAAGTRASDNWAEGDSNLFRLKRATDGKVSPDLVVKGTEPGDRPGEPANPVFGQAVGLGVLPDGTVLLADTLYNPRVRRITVDGAGQPHVSTLVRSTGFLDTHALRFSGWLDLSLASPTQLAVGPRGEIRVIDQTAIRAIDLDAGGKGTARVYAGFSYNVKRQDGPIAAATVHPNVITPDGKGGYYIACGNTICAMQLTEMGGAVTRLLAGQREFGTTDGVGDQASFDTPNALTVLPDGSLLTTDYQSNRLRRITFGSDGAATVSTWFGYFGGYSTAKSPTANDGLAGTAVIRPNGKLCLAPDGTIYYGDNYRVRKITRDPDGQLRVTSLAGCNNLGIEYKDGPGDQARFGQVAGMCFDRAGALIAVDTSNNLIRKLVFDAAGKVTVSTIAGKVVLSQSFGFVNPPVWNTVSGYKDGPAAEALFHLPSDITLADDGSLLVTDRGNHAIRRLCQDAAGTWQVSTLIGPGQGMQDGPFSQARLNEPLGLVPDGPGRYLCIDGKFPTNQLRTIRMGVQQ
ncbi:MAG: SMP-30/Gluconolaconase/LRE domain protein [Cyanobacteria bacterium RYN_339]|nr:SMP-30/Gluconolaconase/LRE domain protein [Cyanobacteria bacterium RYN_339]